MSRSVIRLANGRFSKPAVCSFNIEALALVSVEPATSLADALATFFEEGAADLTRRYTPDPAGVSPIKTLIDRRKPLRPAERSMARGREVVPPSERSERAAVGAERTTCLRRRAASACGSPVDRGGRTGALGDDLPGSAASRDRDSKAVASPLFALMGHLTRCHTGPMCTVASRKTRQAVGLNDRLLALLGHDRGRDRRICAPVGDHSDRWVRRSSSGERHCAASSLATHAALRPRSPTAPAIASMSPGRGSSRISVASAWMRRHGSRSAKPTSVPCAVVDCRHR